MLKKSLLLVIIILSTSIQSQNTDVSIKKDSISHLLNFYKKSQDSSFINNALTLANSIKNDSLLREINITYGITSYRNNDLKNLLKSSNNLLNSFQKYNDSLALAKHYHYKALYYRLQHKTDSCFYYYHKSKNTSILIKDSLETGRRLLSMARIQINESDFLGSEITTIEALRYLEPIDAKLYVSRCYNNLGTLLLAQERTENSRFNLKKAYKIGYLENERKKLTTYTNFHLNMALTYLKDKEYKKAINFLKILKTDSIKQKLPTKYYNTIESIAYNNFKLEKNNEALNGFLEVLNYRKKTKNDQLLAISNSILAEFYLTQKKYNIAKDYALKGLFLAKKTNFNERILENYQYLGAIIKGQKGKEYLKKHINLKDSIISSEKYLKDQFAKIRYETEKKDKENNALKVENEKKQLEIEKEQQQKLIGWLLAGASLLFIAFSLVIINSRRKKIEYESKLKQVEAREKERQLIAKSLHDEVAGDIRMLHKKLAHNKMLKEAQELDKVKENVRMLSHQLSSVSFNEVSFKNQIINIVSDYFDAPFIIKVKEIHSIDWSKINNSIKRTLFLAIRESIQNIDKYATANNVILEFTGSKKSILLKIDDDGKGFDLTNKKTGIGLKNMKERIEEINGTFTLNSKINKGTTIKIEIPKNGR